MNYIRFFGYSYQYYIFERYYNGMKNTRITGGSYKNVTINISHKNNENNVWRMMVYKLSNQHGEIKCTNMVYD